MSLRNYFVRTSLAPSWFRKCHFVNVKLAECITIGTDWFELFRISLVLVGATLWLCRAADCGSTQCWHPQQFDPSPVVRILGFEATVNQAQVTKVQNTYNEF